MRSAIRGALLAAVWAALAACAGYSPTPYWTIRDETFATLKPGITTKADVRALVGVPLLESSFPRQGEDVWEYRCLDGQTIMLVYVHFDQGGRYKQFFHMRDPATYSAGTW